MKLSRLIAAFIFACTAALAGSQVLARPAVAPSELPAVIRSCTKANTFYELVGQTTSEGVDLYYLRSSASRSEFSPLDDWYTLISVSNKQCFRQRDETSALAPLSNIIPLDAAQQLELQRFQAEIAALGGKAAFEAQLDRMLNPQPRTYFEGVPVYFSQEQVWALRQLGVRFSSNYQLLPGL